MSVLKLVNDEDWEEVWINGKWNDDVKGNENELWVGSVLCEYWNMWLRIGALTIGSNNDC